MADYLRFEYMLADPRAGNGSLMPYLAMTISANSRSAQISGLLDSGASVNALPFGIGESLGFNWEFEKTLVRLTGNLARVECKVIYIDAIVGQFPSTQLIFAWARVDGFPPILGQTNFFMNYDVCFYRSRSAFDVRPKE